LRCCMYTDVRDERGGAIRHFQLFEGDVLIHQKRKNAMRLAYRNRQRGGGASTYLSTFELDQVLDSRITVSEVRMDKRLRRHEPIDDAQSSVRVPHANISSSKPPVLSKDSRIRIQIGSLVVARGHTWPAHENFSSRWRRVGEVPGFGNITELDLDRWCWNTGCAE